MPVVHACSYEGCATLTMGELCLNHEREQEREWQRRPDQRASRRLASIAPASALLAAVIAAGLLKTRVA